MALKDLLGRKKNADSEASTEQVDASLTQGPEADRGIPSVNAKRRTSAGTRAMQVLILLVGLGILVTSLKVIIGKFSQKTDEQQPAVQTKKDEPQKIENHAPLKLDVDDMAPGGSTSAATPALPASGPTVPGVQAAGSAPQGGAVQAAPNQSRDQGQPIAVRSTGPGAQTQRGGDKSATPLDPDERRMSKGMKYGGSGELGLRAADGAGDSLLGGANGAQTGSGNNGLGPLLNSTKTVMSTARLLPDPDFYIAKGTVIDCTAQEAIDTTQPGMLNCIGSTDVYSKSQRVVLLERGTVFTVEYQKGLVQGQNKIFLLASSAVTPGNVEVELDSPVTDSLGRAGLGGTVNTHFWPRFGGAIMLGVIGDIGQALVASVSKGNSQVTVSNTAGGAQQAMAEALRATINIPPTLETNQGAHIKLYVARHLDFRSVYALAPK